MCIENITIIYKYNEVCITSIFVLGMADQKISLSAFSLQLPNSVVTVRAPCVVKLLGEHAVVHGRTAVAAALELYAFASFKRSLVDGLELELKDYNKKVLLSNKILTGLLDIYKKRESLKSYIELSKLDSIILPYATIAAIFYERYKVMINGTVSISSEIPKQSGLASSASCYSAFTVLLVKLSGKTLSDDEIIELARDGERVSHMNEGAGRIDISTAYYGGYVSFSNKAGFVKHNFKVHPKLLVINTGPKKPTAVTVGRVSELLNENKEHTEKILDSINECSIKGLDALAKNKMQELGALMYKDHELLKELEVSNEGLDKAVDIAKKHNAHGAKLSGGGGGGIAIALLKTYDKKLEEELQKGGFSCIKAHISEKGSDIITT